VNSVAILKFRRKKMSISKAGCFGCYKKRLASQAGDWGFSTGDPRIDADSRKRVQNIIARLPIRLAARY
jgi:hypothetical protein